jgi:Recombination endonuclease VII
LHWREQRRKILIMTRYKLLKARAAAGDANAMAALEKRREYDRRYRRAHPEKGREYSRRYDKKHPEKKREYSRRYRRAHLEEVRERNRRRRYSITQGTFDSMLLAQGGCCAICAQPPNGKGLGVDHDHNNGTVRGLLCDKCNTAIGLLNDDPGLLSTALAYLKKSLALAHKKA